MSKVKCICKECGVEFEARLSDIKKGRGKFCSRKCAGKSHSKNMSGEKNPNWVKKIKCVCKQCGKEFETTPFYLKTDKSKFCSNKCYGKWQSKNSIGENGRNWKGGEVKCICKECGEEFNVPQSGIKRGNGKFCSTECAGIWRSKNICGPNNPSWIGGKSFEPYCPKFNNSLKRRVRIFWGNKSAFGNVDNKELAVHHVYYEKKACCIANEDGSYSVEIDGQIYPIIGTPDKFIPLTQKEHARVNGSLNKVWYMRFFENLINTKFNGKSYWTEDEYNALVLEGF